MISMATPTMTILNHLGNKKDSMEYIIEDVYAVIIASSITMFAVLLLLHL